jgi:hypothetical protein
VTTPPILFGAGIFASPTAHALGQRGIVPPCVADNSREKQGLTIRGISVVSPWKARERFPAAPVVITAAPGYIDSIRLQARDLGVHGRVESEDWSNDSTLAAARARTRNGCYTPHACCLRISPGSAWACGACSKPRGCSARSSALCSPDERADCRRAWYSPPAAQVPNGALAVAHDVGLTPSRHPRARSTGSRAGWQPARRSDRPAGPRQELANDSDYSSPSPHLMKPGLMSTMALTISSTSPA